RPAQPKPKGCQFPRALCRDQGLGSSLVCTPCATCKAQHHARVIARTVDGGLKCSAWQGERIWQCLPGGRPRELFSNKPINVQRLTTKPVGIERHLKAMEVFDAFRHLVRCSSAAGADLQDAAVHLYIERQNMAAQVCENAL